MCVRVCVWQLLEKGNIHRYQYGILKIYRIIHAVKIL